MKKSISALILFGLFFCNSSFGQITRVYQMIQSSKENNTSFVELTLFKELNSDLKIESDQTFDNPNIKALAYDSDIYFSLHPTIILEVPINNRAVYLELIEVDKSFYNYKIETSSGDVLEACLDYRFYRGGVRGEPQSLVAISFNKDEVRGIVSFDGINYNISRDKESGKYFIFSEHDLSKRPNIEMYPSYPIAKKEYKADVILQDRNLLNVSNVCVELYYETEFDVFTSLGGVTQVEFYVASLYNEVATLLKNEDINSGLSRIFVWTKEDPYLSNAPDTLLTQFQNERTHFIGDLGQLLTFRHLDYTGYAILDGICDSQVKNRLSVARTLGYVYPVPVFTHDVYISAHEFGHSFGSRHTHDCVWNGNNTAIDGCEVPVGCPDPGIPIGGGTIMSYCGLNIDFALGFGLQPGNLIRNNILNASCLGCCTSGTHISGSKVLCSSDLYSINWLPFGSTVSWSVSPSNGAVISGGGEEVTLTKNSNYEGPLTLIGHVNNECGNHNVVYHLWGGRVTNYYIDGPSSIPVNEPKLYFAENTLTAPALETNWNWFFVGTIPDSYSLTPKGPGVVEVIVGSSGNYQLAVSLSNSCGVTAAATINIEVFD